MGPFFPKTSLFTQKSDLSQKFTKKRLIIPNLKMSPKNCLFFKMPLIIPIKRALFRKWDPKKKVPFLKTEKNQITPYNPKNWKNWGPFLRYHFGKKGTIFGYFVVCTPGKTRPHFEKKRSLFWGKKGTESHVRKSWRD